MKDKFTAKMSMSDCGHFDIGPVNWSDIVAVETLDVSKADSAEWDNRNEAILVIHQDEEIHRMSFGRDHELRDKVYALIVDHQKTCLKSY